MIVVRAKGTEINPLSDERTERLPREPETGRQRSIRSVGARPNWHRHTMEATLYFIRCRMEASEGPPAHDRICWTFDL